MEEVSEPRNDLERRLQEVHAGSVETAQFLRELLDAQIFMPVQDQDNIGGFQRTDKATPLSLEAEDGTVVLILFTSPERAKDFLTNFPGYGGGLLTDFRWVLERVGSGVGIAVNPDWDMGIDLDPDMVTALRSEMDTAAD